MVVYKLTQEPNIRGCLVCLTDTVIPCRARMASFNTCLVSLPECIGDCAGQDSPLSCGRSNSLACLPGKGQDVPRTKQTPSKVTQGLAKNTSTSWRFKLDKMVQQIHMNMGNKAPRIKSNQCYTPTPNQPTL